MIEETGQFTNMVNTGRVDVWREKMSSNLNIFILAFSATSQWRGQTTLVSRTEWYMDLELLGVLFHMCSIKKCPDEVIQGDIIEKDFWEAMEDMTQAEILSRFLMMNN